MRENLSALKEEGNLNPLLESLDHGLLVLQGVEESLNAILESFRQTILKGKVKECVLN